MLKRLWFLLCALWAGILLLIGLITPAAGDPNWAALISWAAAPVALGYALAWAARFVLTGEVRAGRLRVYRR